MKAGRRRIRDILKSYIWETKMRNITMNHIDTFDENPDYSQFSMRTMNDTI